MSTSQPKTIADILAKVLARPSIRAGLARAQVVSEWEERVGPQIAAVSSVRSFSEGTLFVEVRSSAWLMELEMMKREILSCLNGGKAKGPIDKIVFVLASAPNVRPHLAE